MRSRVRHIAAATVVALAVAYGVAPLPTRDHHRLQRS